MKKKSCKKYEINQNKLFVFDPICQVCYEWQKCTNLNLTLLILLIETSSLSDDVIGWYTVSSPVVK